MRRGGAPCCGVRPASSFVGNHHWIMGLAVLLLLCFSLSLPNDDGNADGRPYPPWACEADALMNLPPRLDKNLTILWTVRKKAFEFDWIHELLNLANIPYIDQFVPEPEPGEPQIAKVAVYPDVLVVLTYGEHSDYLSVYERLNIPFAILQTSDEFYKLDTSYVKNKACRFVFRNYHLSTLPKDATCPVRTFGLGYKTGFWDDYQGADPVDLSAGIRPLAWTFHGAAHLHDLQYRIIPLQLFLDVRPHSFLLTDAFGRGWDVKEYRDILLKSKFTLCPVGHEHLDTFRIYEAMEAGSIPVVLSSNAQHPHYWEDVFGVPQESLPFVLHPTWPDHVKEVQWLLQDITRYETRRLQVVAFWQCYKRRLANQFRERIEAFLYGLPQPP